MPVLKQNGTKYSQTQLSEIKKKAYEFFNLHLLNFQKIIKSITKSYPKFNKKYEVDDNPNISLISDSELGWALTFSNLWDNSNDTCNSELQDPAILDKAFEMENKIIRELMKYCDEHGLQIRFTNDTSNWDDAGIYCNMDIDSLLMNKHESTIFESVKFI